MSFSDEEDAVLKQIQRELRKHANPVKAGILSRFFRTGKGEYGEGDRFLGITVPAQRGIARRYVDLSLLDAAKLLSSPIHEYRLTALLILVLRYQKADRTAKGEIVNFYLANTRHVNNWDLVDLSAHHILGNYLLDRDKSILIMLARSDNLWERRIATLATLAFIRKNRFRDAFRVINIVLHDEHDLIHRAAGWMLREIGKRDEKAETTFLEKHRKEMPRTMLRYAVERLDERQKRYFLAR